MDSTVPTYAAMIFKQTYKAPLPRPPYLVFAQTRSYSSSTGNNQTLKMFKRTRLKRTRGRFKCVPQRLTAHTWRTIFSTVVSHFTI